MYIYLYIYTNKRNKRIWDIHVLGRDCPCSSAFWWFCRFYVSTLLLGIRASTGSMRILFGGLYKGTFKLFRIRTWLLSYCNYFKVCFPKIHMLKHNDQCYVIRRWGFGKVLGCWVGAPINHISALVKAPLPHQPGEVTGKNSPSGISSSPGITSAWTLILDFSDSRNKCLCL